ncbi:hypothetical protein [Elizabethkingia anophelis]|uniref:hypothetical protein n=1 Tax=Elizabethkingia anophelis TaxID=1117645 RepID=UPI00372E797A
MKKALLNASLLGMLAFSLLSSCRTEDNINQQNQAEDKRFAVFVSKSPGEKIDYAKGFSSLYQNYYEVNDISTKDQKTIANDFGVVDFGLHTQLLTYNNGTKAMFFPLIKENKIDGIVMAVLEKGDTSLRYTKLEESYKNYSDILNGFIALEKMTRKDIIHISSDRSLVGGSFIAIAPPAKDPPILYVNGERNEYDDNNGSGSNSNNETLIPGVTITVPKPDVPLPPPSPMNPTNPTPPINPGGCGSYGGCSNGGSGGAGGTPAIKANQEIINNLKDYPCAQKLLQDLKTDLNNDLAKLIVNALGDDNKSVQVNFFGEEFDDSQLNGQTRRVDKIGDKIMKFDIALSKDMLQNATQEYVLATMYHEFVHAYLGYQFKTLGADVYHAKYPYIESYIVGGVTKFKFKTGDHQAFTPFINMITDALRIYNPNIPSKVATALAMQGLIDEESPNPYLPDGADLINQQERKSDKYSQGTKCAKQ